MSRYNSAFALLLNEGTCTSDGSVGNNTLVDSALIGKNDFLTYNMVEIISGGARLETRDITEFDNVTGTITVHQAFSVQILTGVGYRVYAIKPENIPVQDATTNLLMRDVLGNKTDTAATPSNTTSVVAILKKLHDGTIGTPASGVIDNLNVNTEQDLVTEVTVTTVIEVDSIYVDFTNWLADANITGAAATLTIKVYLDDDGGTLREVGNLRDVITESVSPGSMVQISGLETFERNFKVTVQSSIAPAGGAASNLVKYHYISYDKE